MCYLEYNMTMLDPGVSFATERSWLTGRRMGWKFVSITNEEHFVALALKSYETHRVCSECGTFSDHLKR
jgi:hypothetical protein